MGREIKFRAWHIKQGKMVHANRFKGIMNTAYPGYHIMQFTGLTDKNGKEIYEGDILKGRHGNHSVGMDMIEFRFYANDNWSWFLDNEVIGNIYENPELL